MCKFFNEKSHPEKLVQLNVKNTGVIEQIFNSANLRAALKLTWSTYYNSINDSVV